MDKKLTFAIDFDGCITEYGFPKIGEQTNQQLKLLLILNKLKKKGHKLILWTSRGTPALEEAIRWCNENGLEFDAHNENPFYEKKSGPSPKIIADYYIDDKALEFGDDISRKRSLKFLKSLLDE